MRDAFVESDADVLDGHHGEPRRRWSGKLLGTLLVAGIGIGASALSCVGQSFTFRQARALEGIEQQLRQLNASCSLRKEIP